MMVIEGASWPSALAIGWGMQPSTRRKIEERAGTYAPVIMNALSLLDDAKSIRKHRRYATATALAVLSLEEVGKFMLLAGRLKDQINFDNGGKLTHRMKQKAASVAIMGVMGYDETRVIAESLGYRSVIVPINERDGLGHVHLVDIVEEVTDEHFNRHVAPIIRNPKQNKFVVDLVRGRFDAIKQSCFYVDMGGDGGVIRSPANIDRETCDRIIRLASRAISATIYIRWPLAPPAG
jgi:hypothetical protein